MLLKNIVGNSKSINRHNIVNWNIALHFFKNEWDCSTQTYYFSKCTMIYHKKWLNDPQLSKRNPLKAKIALHKFKRHQNWLIFIHLTFTHGKNFPWKLDPYYDDSNIAHNCRFKGITSTLNWTLIQSKECVGHMSIVLQST